LRTLLFGYGNIYRQDDGVAWHLLHEIMLRNNIHLHHDVDLSYRDNDQKVDYVFELQLTPETANCLSDYNKVCFMDAHTGALPNNIHLEPVRIGFQKSPFTHHLTPSSLLAIASTILTKVPETILVSVRGYEFGFSQSLSQKTAQLVGKAADSIINWMEDVNS
jgi:hydrogenase maturation protease